MTFHCENRIILIDIENYYQLERRAKMLTLGQGTVGKIYEIAGFHPSLMQESHLRNLGIVMGSQVKLIATQQDGGIITIHQTKIALDQEILNKILVAEATDFTRISLDEMKVGQKGQVATVIGAKVLKRRLLDMGITKGTEIVLKKVAPLGDPLEIKIRGYELTLRKEEAQQVMVYLEEAE